MDVLIQRFMSTGRFAEDQPTPQSPPRDRVRYTVHANRVLLREQLPVVSSLLASVPLGQTWVASSLRLTNTDVVARTVNLRDVPYGEISSAAFDWVSDLSIAPGETIYIYGIEDVWEGGYSIYGNASAANVVNVKIMGTPLVDS